MRGLAGKRVLVSGGSSGIGAATARRLLSEGCRVHLGGLEATEVATAVADLGEPFLDITAANWDRVIAVNLRGMFLVAQACARVMVAQNTGGSIVNMSSTNGLGGEAEYTHYNASKAGVLLLTRTMGTGTPDEVAAAYAFLASDEAAFITGTEIVVDGGQTAVM